MAHAATSAIFYPTLETGAPDILAQFDCVVAGSEVIGGRVYVGLFITVDPTNDTPNTLKNKVGDAVRLYATQGVQNTNGQVGVSIPANGILMGDFQKG